MALLLGGEVRVGFRIVQCDQARYNGPSVQRTQLDGRNYELAAKNLFQMCSGRFRLCQAAESAKPTNSLALRGGMKHLVVRQISSLATILLTPCGTHIAIEPA